MKKNERKLRRIKNGDSVLGGVTQGLGEYFDIDPTLFRALFVIMFFTPLPAFITYLILWIVLPEERSDFAYANGNNESSFKPSKFTTMSNNSSKNGNLIGGIVLISLGAIFAFRTFFDINLFHYIGKMWPLFLIGLGVWIIIRDNDDTNNFDSTHTPGGSLPQDSETF
ncbi:MAG: phage shock protein C [Arcticibacterium sp.]|jgi:phage shock protein C